MVEEKLKRSPREPGVYLLKDAQEKVIYVGKARILRTRLRSHFCGFEEDPKHRAMMRKVVDFETVVTDSEVEALILEANLVKEYRPRYNINLKDDKSFPYIRVTAESYPCVFITRKIIRDGSKYFGPYTDVGSMRQIMTGIRRVFPIRTCQLKIDEHTIQQKKHKVCLNYHIGRCLGPCEGLISHEAYHWHVDRVIAFIQGKAGEVVESLKERMGAAATNRQFEEAAKLRDEIQYIEGFKAKQKVVDASFADRDILVTASDAVFAVGMVFKVRDGKIVDRRHFRLTFDESADERDLLNSFLKQYYLRTDNIPSEILVPITPEDETEIIDWLTERRGAKVRLIMPKRGDKVKLLDLCQRNARLILDEIRTQKEASEERVASSVSALQADLRLKTPPLRIEAFDISNLQGTDSVASLVVFENGKPRKSEYRKYKIKTVEGADDFASMAEVLERRFTRLLNEDAALPDLLLVDGGKGQLSSAVSILQKLGLEGQSIIGLAKRLEEVYLPGFSDPQNIPKHSASLHLLQRIRDEAHRFAVSFHRQRRRKRILHSELDDIPGIGEKRKHALLKALGSVERIRKASLEEVAGIEGMNRKLADMVIRALNSSIPADERSNSEMQNLK